VNIGKRAPLILALWSALALARGHIDSMDLLNRITPGVTKAEEVSQILGQPATTMRFGSLRTMEYEARDLGTRIRISITIGPDGVVRDIKRMTQTGP